MKKLLFVLLFTGLIAAQQTGKTGMSFLKNGSSAEIISLGDLGVIGSGSILSAFYNPALIISGDGELAFSNNKLFVDLNTRFFAGSRNIFGLPVTLIVNNTTVDNIEIRQQPGEMLDKFSVSYFSASLSTAFNITENIDAGVTIKFLNENLYVEEASGYAADLGFTYKSVIDNLDFGLAVRNLGKMSVLKNTASDLPADLRLGFSYKYKLESVHSSVKLITGYVNYFNEEESHFTTGIELRYDEIIALRAGYITNNESKNLSCGIGANWKGIYFDYAYVPVKYNLGDNHILTLGYKF